MIAIEKMQRNGIPIDVKLIDEIVSRYKISELSVFGSSIREDFNEKSDVDLVIVFEES